MKLLISELLFLLCCMSCNLNDKRPAQPGTVTNTSIEFDKTKWMTGSDYYYPYRDKMLKDLMGNGKLKGLKKDKVLDLLGEPTRRDSNYLFYRVVQKSIGV